MKTRPHYCGLAKAFLGLGTFVDYHPAGTSCGQCNSRTGTQHRNNAPTGLQDYGYYLGLLPDDYLSEKA